MQFVSRRQTDRQRYTDRDRDREIKRQSQMCTDSILCMSNVYKLFGRQTSSFNTTQNTRPRHQMLPDMHCQMVSQAARVACILGVGGGLELWLIDNHARVESLQCKRCSFFGPPCIINSINYFLDFSRGLASALT